MENYVTMILFDLCLEVVQCFCISAGILLFTAGLFELAERFVGDN